MASSLKKQVLGLVTEYNPFHNGHKYHLEQSKGLCSADYVVCVMSGNFIQRGEPAIVNKWARAEMAVLAGADLVLELPVVYAMASAEFFAYAAVKILDSIGITNCICFGSESGEIETLDKIAEILCKEPPLFRTLLKEQLDKGKSFPVSRQSALLEYVARSGQIETAGDIGFILEQSNNILGIEYLKALKKLGSKIKPYTIKRINNEYGTQRITGGISSATSIRKQLEVNSPALNGMDFAPTVAQTMPNSSCGILKREFGCGRGPVFPGSFGDILLAMVRKMSTGRIKALPYVSEGLENRIKDAADASGSFEEFIEKACTKRYPATRIQRIVFSILTGMDGAELENFNKFGGPQYARVLGFNDKGRHLLSLMKTSSLLPVITKAANFKNSCNPLLRRMLQIESATTDMYVLGYANPEFRKAGQEFTQSPVFAVER